jgi:hypothetical protein
MCRCCVSLDGLEALELEGGLLSCLCRVGLSSDPEALLEGGGLVLVLVLCLETFDLLLEVEVIRPLLKVSLKHHAPLLLEGANLLMKAHNPLLDWKPGLLLLIMLLQICQ